MSKKTDMQQLCHKILEDNGGQIADKARTILLGDPNLNDLQAPLDFVSRNWRNPLSPALMRLSCEVVGGQPEKTYDAALAVSLMSLSFFLWDDIIDQASSKSFKPTLFGEFGESTSIIIGGLAAAKAFLILNQLETDKTKSQAIAKLCWALWSQMARAETVTLKWRDQEIFSSGKKLWKIKAEAIDLKTCMRIGGILGNGSANEVKHLGEYGLCLGIILELIKDFYVTINLTTGLFERIRSGALPYSLLWASERSERLRKRLDAIAKGNVLTPLDIKKIVEETLKAEALENSARIIKLFTKKAKKELAEIERDNPAVRTLQLLIEGQSPLFISSLTKLLV